MAETNGGEDALKGGETPAAAGTARGGAAAFPEAATSGSDNVSTGDARSEELV